MNNILNLVAVAVGIVVTILYSFIGIIMDCILKAIAFIICVPLVIVFCFIVPFNRNCRKYWKKIQPLCNWGGKWGFKAENYKIFNFFLTKLLD